MFVKINGETHYLWRAVDHEGEILESYVTKKRDKKAALRFLKKALRRHDQAEKIVTDDLKSYPAAMRELGNEGRREMGRWKNNRVENSHLPFRRKERVMQRFRRMKTLQKFVSVNDTLELSLRFVANPYKLWDLGTFKLKRMVLRMVFPEPLQYDRDAGYRNPQKALIFAAFGSKSGQFLPDLCDGARCSRERTRLLTKFPKKRE